jgi:hypothetical protein
VAAAAAFLNPGAFGNGESLTGPGAHAYAALAGCVPSLSTC